MRPAFFALAFLAVLGRACVAVLGLGLPACQSTACDVSALGPCPPPLRLLVVDAKTGAGLTGVQVQGAAMTCETDHVGECLLTAPNDVTQALHLHVTAPGHAAREVDAIVPAPADCGCATTRVQVVELTAA